MRSEKAETRKGRRTPAPLATQLLQMRLSDQLLETMEEEGVRPSELESSMGEQPGFAARALAGDLPVKTLREALRRVTRAAAPAPLGFIRQARACAPTPATRAA